MLSVPGAAAVIVAWRVPWAGDVGRVLGAAEGARGVLREDEGRIVMGLIEARMREMVHVHTRQ